MTALQKIDWTDEGMFHGGTVGGDGAGEAWNRLFSAPLDDGTFAVVDFYAYPVNVGERYGEDREDANLFDVETLTTLTICTDLESPSETALWSDDFYDFPLATAFDTEEAAVAYCKSAARGTMAGDYGNPTEWTQ